jgi:hypothetical protein
LQHICWSAGHWEKPTISCNPHRAFSAFTKLVGHSNLADLFLQEAGKNKSAKFLPHKNKRCRATRCSFAPLAPFKHKRKPQAYSKTGVWQKIVVLINFYYFKPLI